MSRSNYPRQLAKRWGLRAPRQLVRMMKLHRTPFQTILHNMFAVLEEVDGRFAFPTIAAVAKMKPDLVKMIVDEGHEVASHGYNHVRYPTLTSAERERDLKLSLQVFKKMGIEVNGFRAPYDNYTDDMPELIEQTVLIWDGGFGYRAEHREKTHFFHADISGQKSRVTYIPLNIQSDDRLIDSMGLNPQEVTKTLNAEVSNAAKTNGIIMFDLHPIRMGQPDYVGCLRDVTQHAIGLGAWCTTPTEAVKYWNTHGRWKGDSTFCLLLTGDIDNWVFSDYLRRVL
ncbi:MAG: polysaccharide deacetylase family protein, partial [Candidatus Thorarchaeota archaeon]